MGLLLSGLGAATGALGNTQAARTGTSTSNTGGSFSNTTARTLMPEQQDLLSQLRKRAGTMMTDPSAGLQPFRTAAVNSVNNSFNAAEPTLRARYLGTGTGRSGKYGRAARIAETARLGKTADVDNQVGQKAVQRQDDGSALMERLLGINFGSTNSGTTASNSTGTNVAPGSAVAGGLGGGLATFQALMNQMLQMQANGGGN